MTHDELIKKYHEFRNKYNGKYIDYDGQYGAQCWDLGQKYFTECLGLPPSVLGGCGLVSNMLYPPKREQLDKYFNEVKLTEMEAGDVVIWDGTIQHIAIFDNWDGKDWHFFSQNYPEGSNCHIQIIYQDTPHAFRFKTKSPEKDYKKLYFEEVEKNNILQEKINKAIKDLT